MNTASQVLLASVLTAGVTATAFLVIGQPSISRAASASPRPESTRELEALRAELDRRAALLEHGDAELDRLRGELADLDRIIAALRAELAEREHHPMEAELVTAAPTRVEPRSVSPAALDWLRGLVPEEFGDLTAEEAAYLRKLDLSGRAVCDADLAHLASFPSLKLLNLRQTEVTDVGLLNVSGLWKLQELDLRSTGVEGTAFHALPAGLESLNLTDTQVSGEALLGLVRMPKLKTLDLNQLALGDDVAEVISYMPAIRKIELDGTAITDAGLRRLLQLNPALERIEIRGTETTWATVDELRRAHPELTIVKDDWRRRR